jgi:L-fucose isomerase-like protein
VSAANIKQDNITMDIDCEDDNPKKMGRKAHKIIDSVDVVISLNPKVFGSCGAVPFREVIAEL